ncbi:hypothetical protein D3C76_1823440 [compost metagenome]
MELKKLKKALEDQWADKEDKWVAQWVDRWLQRVMLLKILLQILTGIQQPLLQQKLKVRKQ